MATGINIVGVRWRRGRHGVCCCVVVGGFLWYGAHDPARAQQAPAPDNTASNNAFGDNTTNQRPFETGTMLERAMGFGPSVGQNAPSPPGFVVTGKAGAELTFTDNAFLTPTDQKSDFIVTPNLALNAMDTTLRTSIVADGEIDYDYYTTYHSLSGARPTGLLEGLVDVVPDEFSVQARLATNLEQINPTGQTPATDRTFNANQVQVINYGGRPTWREHIGDEVQTEVYYDFGAVNFVGASATPGFAQASNAIQQNAQATISNGTNFTHLGWAIIGSWQELDPSGPITLANPRTSGEHGEASLQDRVTSSFSLTGRGGYDYFHNPDLANDVTGPFGLGGFSWTPERNISVHAEAGYRFGGFNADGSIVYNVGRDLNVSASYERDLQSTQQILISNLANLTNPAGPIATPSIDPATGLPVNLSGLNPSLVQPANPNQSAIGYLNIVFRHDRAQGAVAGDFNLGRDTYNVAVNYDRYASLLGNSNSLDVEASIGHLLTPFLKASIQGSYQKVGGGVQELGPVSIAADTKTATARIDYRLGPTITTNLRYVYLWRSAPLIGTYRENAIVLSAIKSF